MFDKDGIDLVIEFIVFWGSNRVTYDLWIPVISIAAVGVTLLFDFDPADPLETTSLEGDVSQDTDPFAMNEPLENIDDPTFVDFPLSAANSPEAPTNSAPQV